MDTPLEAVRPFRPTQAASLRAAVSGVLLLLVIAVVSVTIRPESPMVLYEGWNTVPDYSFAKAMHVDSACGTCMSDILKQHEPWKHGAYLDPEMAMSCVRGNCGEAAKQAMKSAVGSLDSELQRVGRSGSPTSKLAAVRPKGAATTSMEQYAFDEKALDRRQLHLNWKRAKTFARYFGKPSARKVDLVMTSWVPPLDPAGRPVPSWLTFEPTAMNSAQIAAAADTANVLQQQGSSNSVWTPQHSLLALTQSLAEATPTEHEKAPDASEEKQKAPSSPGNCLVQTSCHGCTGSGCNWCAAGSICAESCPFTDGSVSLTTIAQCNAQTSLLTAPAHAVPEEDAALRKKSAAAVEKQRANREALQDLVHLSQETAGNTLVNSEMAVEMRLRAEDVHSKDDPAGPTLADALAPLNDEQTRINHDRQMLYFRMETDLHPGESAGHVDNFAKPTTTWSLIGRPMSGWLHWGDDNDGGYLNPVGGTYWDPAVVNPAEDKGSYGPAVNAYKRSHPHPADEEASMAGGALFGT